MTTFSPLHPEMLCERLSQNSSVEGILLLTANRRLANAITQQFDEYQREQGKKTWASAAILPLNTWLEETYLHAYAQPKYLLNTWQEREIWQKIIKDSEQQALLNIPATAELAQQAWQILNNWNFSLEEIKQQHHQASENFIKWAKKFLQEIENKGWISVSNIPSILTKNIQPITAYKEIILYGFDDFPPAIQILFEKLAKQSTVSQVMLNQEEGKLQRIALPDQTSEMTVMAKWAKHYHQQHPEHKIACIVPNLTQIRPKLNRIFNQVFHIEAILPNQNPPKQIFNISSGQALNQFIIVQDALKALKICQNQIEVESISHFLQSPYLSQNASDQDLGALCDARLREMGELFLSLDVILIPFTQLHPQYPNSTWLSRWTNLLAATKKIKNKLKPSDWANFFIHILEIMGWPGQRGLNSLEYQLVNRWQNLLIEFSQLDAIQNEISFAHALKQLEQLTQKTLFQAESADVNIDVLGLLEAAGNHFDAIWMMNLSDQHWPGTANPNPFIPYHIQRTHNMPHASAKRELEYAKQITKRIKHSAQHIIFSYPLQADGQMITASPLITEYPEIQLSALSLPENTTYVEQILQTQQLEILDDAIAMPVSNHETLHGGSWILKQQAACPFQAFAHIRLQAESLAEPALGLAPNERGSLLHSVLEIIWQQLKEQKKLLQLDPQVLDQFIHNSVEKVLREYTLSFSSYTHRHFLKLEAKRLFDLVKEWLEFEKERPAFTVLAQETRQQITLNNLAFNITIDRIDELEDGTQIIIDYKTGLTNINTWFGERPQEPQLPLYCIYAAENNHSFNAISFAQVRAKQMKWRGLIANITTAEAISWPGLTRIDKLNHEEALPDWQKQIQHWQKILTQLSDDFLQGHAQVDPLDINTCNFCDLHALCRINQCQI